MTVRLSNFNVGMRAGGVKPVTSFTDTFNRASGELGSNWAAGMSAITPVANNIFLGAWSIAASNDATQSLQGAPFSSAGSGTQVPSFCFPLPLANSLVFGRTQHCQVTFKDYTAANNLNLEIGCFFKPGALYNGYWLECNLHAPSISLSKFSPNAQNAQGSALNSSVLVAAPINGNAFAAGDIIRVSVDVDTTPGSAIVTVKVNGVQKAQFTDNTPLTGGIPAIGMFPAGTGFHVINFDGGLGV